MINADEITTAHKLLPAHIFTRGVNLFKPFVFIDFEVFKHDWLICFSVGGAPVLNIINDISRLKEVFNNRLKDSMIVAYNGSGYDKYIMLALLNGLDVKEVSDKLINDFNFSFWRSYGKDITVGKDLMFYDPMTRNSGSLKTYEACQGENIYESNVQFDIDRPLTQEEINETIKYCTFDVQMLIQYFYRENFDSFLGHVGLIDSTLNTRPYLKYNDVLDKTDASLVGTYLCSDKGMDLTTETDVITLPDNIILGKYEDQIKEFLKMPIKILKNGSYNGLNAWALKTIEKAKAKGENNPELEKLIKKEERLVNQIKKAKEDIQTLSAKEKLTEKQKIKLDNLPNDIVTKKSELETIRTQIEQEQTISDEIKKLIEESKNYKDDLKDANYNYLMSKIIEVSNIIKDDGKTKKSVLDKKAALISYLKMSAEDVFNFMYREDKKGTSYNSITTIQDFETRLMIKGVPHLFKTGGIHSVFGKPMFFNKNTEHDRNRRLLIADVGSLYPNIMRVFGLCSIGMDDPAAYAQMIFDRIELKKKGDPYANVLKLILNTTYGCMGSEYNNLREHTNRLKVCIYGQCCIVDLLDKLENEIKGLEIFQSNTDGILISCEDYEYDRVEEIIHEWEHRTGLEMEIDESIALYQRDVSNYILVEK